MCRTDQHSHHYIFLVMDRVITHDEIFQEICPAIVHCYLQHTGLQVSDGLELIIMLSPAKSFPNSKLTESIGKLGVTPTVTKPALRG